MNYQQVEEDRGSEQTTIDRTPDAELFGLGRRRFLAALAGTVPVALIATAAQAQKPKPTPTPAPTDSATPTPTPTPTPPPDEVYARLAYANRFTAPQTIETGGPDPVLLLRHTAAGPVQEWHTNGKKVAGVQSVGLRVFAQDGNDATDFCDFRNAPDEFGLYNESTHRQPDGTLTNGDIVLYAPWRIRACLKNPHLSNGHFEIREMYEVGPGPIEPEYIPFRIQHGRPAWGSGVHDYVRIKPNFGHMGAASDGYRVINMDLKADAPASVLGERRLLRLAIAGDDRFTVDNAGNVATRGAVRLRGAAPADGDLAAGELALWFDPSTAAPKLMMKGRDAGGSIRTGSVDLT